MYNLDLCNAVYHLYPNKTRGRKNNDCFYFLNMFFTLKNGKRGNHYRRLGSCIIVNQVIRKCNKTSSPKTRTFALLLHLGPLSLQEYKAICQGTNFTQIFWGRKLYTNIICIKKTNLTSIWNHMKKNCIKP